MNTISEPIRDHNISLLSEVLTNCVIGHHLDLKHAWSKLRVLSFCITESWTCQPKLRKRSRGVVSSLYISTHTTPSGLFEPMEAHSFCKPIVKCSHYKKINIINFKLRKLYLKQWHYSQLIILQLFTTFYNYQCSWGYSCLLYPYNRKNP